MRVLRTLAELRAFLAGRAGVGFVPTMGALHDGHLALMRRARAETALVVASVFVNPLQFGPGEDYERYPRDLSGDLAKLSGVGVDAVFVPSVEEMYPSGAQTVVEVGELGRRLEGAVRPGHFRGVATVVVKLLNAVAPERVYFGQKDWQQTVVVRQVLRDLLLRVTVRVLPTVREPDGLAMSSRNAYLTPGERAAACGLFGALEAGRAALAAGRRAAAEVEAAVAAALAAVPSWRTEYVAALDAHRLVPVDPLAGDVVLAAAGRLGATRLIDNRVLRLSDAGVQELGAPEGWTYGPPSYGFGEPSPLPDPSEIV